MDAFPHYYNPFCVQALVNDKCEQSTINSLYSNVSIIIQNKYSFDVTISGLICCVILIVILMTGQRLMVSLWISLSPLYLWSPHTPPMPGLCCLLPWRHKSVKTDENSTQSRRLQFYMSNNDLWQLFFPPLPPFQLVR